MTCGEFMGESIENQFYALDYAGMHEYHYHPEESDPRDSCQTRWDFGP